MAAKIANLAHGERESQICDSAVTSNRAAEMLNVSPRSVDNARVVRDRSKPSIEGLSNEAAAMLAHGERESPIGDSAIASGGAGEAQDANLHLASMPFGVMGSLLTVSSEMCCVSALS